LEILVVLHSIPTLSETSSSNNSKALPYQVANSITTDQIQLEILKLLYEIQLGLKTTKQTTTLTNPLGIKKFWKTPDNQTRLPRRNVGKYYWTYGACNHIGNHYQRKAPEHKDEVIIENKIDGLKAYCSWFNQKQWSPTL